jgi:DNA-binding SARP family transcriptional activator/tetratricopeptide (TPR) repeat protein
MCSLSMFGSHGVEFGVLGPLQVIRDGTAMSIDSAHKPRLVLAALLSQADRPVTVDWLVGVVWGEQPPVSARRNMQHYIHRLRAVLGNDRIASGPDGYVIRAGDGLDAAQFRRLAADGGAALSGSDPARVRDTLRAALDLWRGPAYSEFTDCRELIDEAARLEELRLTVSEQWADAELTLGHHGTLVEGLSELVRTHPYRESLRGLLMRALYGTGRQADALQLFRTTRALLADQLGVEPGPQLQRLHEQMLRGDPQLTVQQVGPVTATAATGGGDGGLPVPRELPAEVAGFVGRQGVLKALDELLPDDSGDAAGPVVICAITGTAGVGKTALAVHWSHRAADRFPDGQFYVNLRGYALGRPLPPIEALTTILTALGTPPQQVPVDVAAAAAQYRSQVAGRRMLIVLDNARSAAQVRPLLPASPGCLVLITSRDRLTGLIAHDGARRLTLEVLSPDESVELLGWMIGRERAAAESVAAAELARTCAHLPLALRIAGASLTDRPHSTIAGYVAELAASGPLTVLAVDDDVAVRGALDLSYRILPHRAQQLFRWLGLVPCPDFTASAAVALTGFTEAQALQALERLVAAHLIVQHAAGRYTLHDLLRRYAADLAATQDSPTQRASAAQRLYDWLTAMSVAAAELLYPEALRLPPPSAPALAMAGLTDTAAALDWLDAERHNLVAAILYAARYGPRQAAWLCADALRGFHVQRGHVADLLSTSRAALAAARADGDFCAQAAAYHGLAHAHLSLDNYGRSITYSHRTFALAAEVGWDHGRAAAAGNIAAALGLQGRTTEAIQYLQRALQVHERIDWPLGRAKELDTLATAYRDVGRLREGTELATQARALYRERAAQRGEASANLTLGELHALLGWLGEAEHLLDSALATFRIFGSRRGEVHCQAWLARVHRDAGRLDQADHSAQRALQLVAEIDEPELQAIARYALALVHQARGNHTSATHLHRAALNIAEQVGISYTVGEALLGLATALHGQGDHHQSALEHAVRALTLAQQSGYAVIEGRAHTTLGQIHHHLGNTTRALDHAHLALINHQETGHRIGEADSHLLLATILQHLGDRTVDYHAHTAQTLYQQLSAPQPIPSPPGRNPIAS